MKERYFQISSHKMIVINDNRSEWIAFRQRNKGDNSKWNQWYKLTEAQLNDKKKRYTQRYTNT